RPPTPESAENVPSGPEADPLLAVLEPLLLPDRHVSLEPLDGVAAALERGRPVRCGHGDDHRRLSRNQRPHPVHDRHPATGPPGFDLPPDGGHRPLGHAWIGFLAHPPYPAPPAPP